MLNRFLISSFLCVVSSSVFATEKAAAQGPGIASNLLLLGGFLFIFYFMLIRPQTKRAKEHQNLVNNIAQEDEVVISGGILGKVTKVTDQFITVSIANETEVVVQRQAVSASLPKGTLKNI